MSHIKRKVESAGKSQAPKKGKGCKNKTADAADMSASYKKFRTKCDSIFGKIFPKTIMR